MKDIARELLKVAREMIAAKDYEMELKPRNVDRAAKELERMGVQIVEKSRRGLKIEVPKFTRRKVKRWMEKNGMGKGAYLERYPELFASDRELVAGDLESTLDGMRNDQARRHVQKLLRAATKGRFSDEAWRPIQKVRNVFDSMGFDYDEPKPSRYWASDFWQRHLESIEGANSPNDHKDWAMEVNFTNDRGRPTTIYVKLTANAIGKVGAGEDVWETYDVDYSAG